MEKKCIGLGVTAGLVAGIASFGYARAQISPLINTAIGYEEDRAHAEAAASGVHGHAHEIFSRSLQENVGAGIGTLVFGVVMGTLFAVAFTVLLTTLRRRGFTTDARGAAVALAFGAFVATTLVPALAYPPNPPGVGLEETIGDRTTAYLVLVVASVALAAGAGAVWFRLAPRLGGWMSAIAAVTAYLVTIVAVVALLPSYREVPGPLTDTAGTVVFPGFPAEVLSDFRVSSLVNQAILWAVVGAGFVVGLSRAQRTGAAQRASETQYAAR